MVKAERQDAILKLIGAMRIARQSELVQTLRDHGFEVTQASVSRDLEELGIVKMNGAYSQPERSGNAFGIGPLGIETAGDHMIVAKTYSGLASASAVRIDGAKIDDIVGTIAGDDTIFIAVTGLKEQRAVVKRLWELFEEK
ncbi:MAG: arginine repressor [Pyrinomonadaceae bacterium]